MNTYPDIRGIGRLVARAARIALVAVVALCVASCGSGGGGSGGTTLMRVFNAIYGGAPVTVTVGSSTAATALPFQSLTVYKQVSNGSQELKVVAAGSTSPIVDVTVSLAGSAQYSYILYGTASTPLTMLVQDAVAPLSTNQFGVRISNAAIGSSGLDAYFTSAGLSLDGVTPNISNVTVGSTSTFAVIPTGTYQVRFTLHNSKQVIYDAGTLTFGNGITYVFVPYSNGSGTLVNAALLVNDTTGNGALANSSLSEFKLVQAAPLTGSVNARVNNVVAFSNVPYQGITSYALEGTGTQTVTIEPSATPGAVIASAQPPFSPATDTSIVVTGLPGSTTALVLADNNIPGTAGSARMRVVNVAPGLGAVDVLVNFATKVSNLATNTAASYFELPADTYTINFDLAGTTTVVLSMPSVDLTSGAGRTYSLYLMGTPNALVGVLTRDD